MKTVLFENDAVTTMLAKFSLKANLKRPVNVAFSNFSGLLRTEPHSSCETIDHGLVLKCVERNQAISLVLVLLRFEIG